MSSIVMSKPPSLVTHHWETVGRCLLGAQELGGTVIWRAREIQERVVLEGWVRKRKERGNLSLRRLCNTQKWQTRGHKMEVSYIVIAIESVN